eukprot:12316592-Prorocentrum_lima.AAC.1
MSSILVHISKGLDNALDLFSGSLCPQVNQIVRFSHHALMDRLPCNITGSLVSIDMFNRDF